MKDGFLKVAAATPDIRVADCDYNAASIISLIKQAEQDLISLIVFPELSITAYTCGDLFLQETLINAAEKALSTIIECTKDCDIVSIIGVPVRYNSALYNCGAVVSKGKLLGLVTKKYIPNYSEFYEQRHFTGGDISYDIQYAGQNVHLGNDIIFTAEEYDEFCFGVEICEDFWVPIPPSSNLALNGALIIANLSASNEIAGKADFRRLLVNSQSARTMSAYIYCDAGEGESTTDLVFSGHNIISQNGKVLAESPLFSSGICAAEIDLKMLAYERTRSNTFLPSRNIKEIKFSHKKKDLNLNIKINPTPFIPSKEALAKRCEELLNIQAAGLCKRLSHTKPKKLLIGLSGGLDSTLALLATVRAAQKADIDLKNILAISMPSQANTQRTKSNAEKLACALGVTFKIIPIDEAMKVHFADIEHTGEFNSAYENAQARERTQILMDMANACNGIMIGTSDLSELALGWTTYNGDHMSMYGVNASIPKTLIKYLVAHEADRLEGEIGDILRDILDTPISPELIPSQNGSEITQLTESVIGPYELHDFFIYYMVRYGFSPKKIFRLAVLAFQGRYSGAEILCWIKTFYKRFFSQQFKRSCVPDAPKVGTVSLSPRGDWRMPSDAVGDVWLKELEDITPQD